MPSDDTTKNPATEPSLDGELLDNRQAAAMLGLSPNVLRDYRTRPKDLHRSPPFQKVGRRVFYRLDDILKFMDEQNG